MIRLLLVGLVLMGCNDKKGPDAPAPQDVTFKLEGKHIAVDAVVKAGTVAPQKVEAAVQTAIEILERD